MKELISIQQNLVATKDKQGMNFKYRTAEDILAAYKVLDVAKTCTLITDTEIVCRGNENGGEYNRERQFVMCTATLTNEAGEKVSARGFAEITDKLGSQSAPQITGSCESYAKKRALGNLFLIEDATSDPDSMVNINADIKSIKNKINETSHYEELMQVARTYWNAIQADKSLNKTYTLKYSALKIAHPEEFPKE